MAAIVTGLVRLFQPSIATMGECKGPVLWYALLSIRLVALFTADNPWSSLKPDFTCNASLSAFCTTLCFNNRFDVPFSSLWSFSFLAVLVPVLLMRMIHQGSGQALGKKGDIELMEPVKEVPHQASSSEPPRHLSVVLLYVACILLLLALELIFLWALVALQLPKVTPQTFSCRAAPCLREVECAIFGRTEKQMALVTLAFTAGVNIAVCVISVVIELMQLSKCQKK